MKINAIQCPSCGDIIYSRSRHDFHWCSCHSVAIDGGFHYMKVSYKNDIPKSIELDLDITEKELHNDYNKGIDKYGLIKTK